MLSYKQVVRVGQKGAVVVVGAEIREDREGGLFNTTFTSFVLMFSKKILISISLKSLLSQSFLRENDNVSRGYPAVRRVSCLVVMVTVMAGWTWSQSVGAGMMQMCRKLSGWLRCSLSHCRGVSSSGSIPWITTWYCFCSPEWRESLKG